MGVSVTFSFLFMELLRQSKAWSIISKFLDPIENILHVSRFSFNGNKQIGNRHIIQTLIGVEENCYFSPLFWSAGNYRIKEVPIQPPIQPTLEMYTCFLFLNLLFLYWSLFPVECVYLGSSDLFGFDGRMNWKLGHSVLGCLLIQVEIKTVRAEASPCSLHVSH